MNKILRLFLSLVLLNFNFSIYSQTQGFVPYFIYEYNETIESNNIYIMDSASYTSGGINFTYPADYFPNKPRIYVSFELNNRVYSSTDVITPIVTSNTIYGATIMVNINDGTSSFEASTDDVTVYIQAFCED